jgi:hypothetical protein
MTKKHRQEALAQEAREKNIMTEDDDLNNMRYKAKYRYETKQPLTDMEIDKAWEWAQRSSPIGVTRLTVFARAIEQAHGIGMKDEPDSSVT